MLLPKYVRLQGRETSYVTKKPVGIWTLCWRRIKNVVFDETDKNKFIEADNWFVENLPYPPFYGENNDDANANTKGAICYFATTYAHKIWERFIPVFELLDKYQIPYDIIYTNYPGKIIYEDEFQVGVIDDNYECTIFMEAKKMSYPFQNKFQKEYPVAKTPHFNIYYYPDSTAEKEIELIKTQREDAYKKIACFLAFDGDLQINFYLFEDAETKKTMTGHTGMGWYFGNNIVEIYNRQAKLDPYHEIVHIIAAQTYGYTAAPFNEGLAVYLSVILNDTTIRDLLGEPYTEKTKKFHENGELFSLKELLSFNSIGSAKTRPEISYRQSASFVEFAIERLGKHDFFALYASLDNGNLESITKKIEAVFGLNLEEVENEWLEWAL